MRPLARTLLWVGIASVCVGVAAAPKLRPLLHQAETKVAQIPPPPGPRSGSSAGRELRVTAIAIQPRNLSEKVTSTGSLRADESVELQAEISGKVIAINFEEGASIRKGELLLKLNDSDLQAMWRRARYRLELAELTERRIAKLRKDGLVRQDEHDAARSDVDVQTAEVALIEAQIAKTEIRAPFDGVVGLRFVSIGAFINAATQVAVLQRLNQLKLDFSVPEKYADRIRIGSQVAFTVAGNDQIHRGQIYAFDPRIDPETRTVLIRARASNPGGSLLPGTFASVELTLSQAADALLVPAVAVIPSLDGKSVFVVEEGRAQRREVKTGIRTDRSVQILSGLQPGDRVITSGLQQVRPDMEVHVEVEPVPAIAGSEPS